MLELGKSATFTKTVVEEDVNLFAKITGDVNPIHISEEFAKKSTFKSRIVHGMLTGSFISTIIGTEMPGSGTIYLEQNMKFIKPVYIGDTVTASVTIIEIINREKGIYKLDTNVVNERDEVVIRGYAIIKYCEL